MFGLGWSRDSRLAHLGTVTPGESNRGCGPARRLTYLFRPNRPDQQEAEGEVQHAEAKIDAESSPSVLPRELLQPCAHRLRLWFGWRRPLSLRSGPTAREAAPSTSPSSGPRRSPRRSSVPSPSRVDGPSPLTSPLCCAGRRQRDASPAARNDRTPQPGSA